MRRQIYGTDQGMEAPALCPPRGPNRAKAGCGRRDWILAPPVALAARPRPLLQRPPRSPRPPFRPFVRSLQVIRNGCCVLLRRYWYRQPPQPGERLGLRARCWAPARMKLSVLMCVSGFRGTRLSPSAGLTLLSWLLVSALLSVVHWEWKAQ